MKSLELKKMEDLESFFNDNNKHSFNVICERNQDDYQIKIQAYSSKSNNEAMMIFKTIESVISFKIFIDSKKLDEAYAKLSDDEKIPSQHSLFDLSSSHKGEYMRLLVKIAYLDIMENLAAYNEKKDDYTTIAKLAFKKRGGVFNYLSGLDKEEYI
jgi:hypothetical protein